MQLAYSKTVPHAVPLGEAAKAHIDASPGEHCADEMCYLVPCPIGDQPWNACWMS